MKTSERIDQVADAIEFGDRLYFKGSPNEMARQFVMATVLLREKIDGAGSGAIDYAQAAMPSADGGAGVGGWLVDAVATMRELERIAREALGDMEQWQVTFWTNMRAPLIEAYDDVLELTYYRPMSKAEALEELGWQGKSLDAIDHYMDMADNALAKVLRERGYCVR